MITKSVIGTGLLLTVTATGLTGCIQQPVQTSPYQQTTGFKVGEACQTQVLGTPATGDASIAAAKRDGDITQVASVDFRTEQTLGMVRTQCTVVTGT